MQVRQALQSEADSIFMMGFDAWSDGQEIDHYLKNCRTSTKYSQGTWYILEDGSKILSSLIVYNFGNGIFGIGSIATAKPVRKQGHASTLIEKVVQILEENLGAKNIFLYSDIGPSFYKKFGFSALPEAFQKSPGSICMIRNRSAGSIDPSAKIPSYF